MEIDIIFKNATPEEARRVFAAISPGKIVKRVGNIQNFIGAAWTDPEKDSIRHCKDRNEAVISYQKAFPDSTRSKHAVYRKFLNLQEEKQETTIPLPAQTTNPIPAHFMETMAQKQASVDAPGQDFKLESLPRPKKESKYQIPFSPRSQKKEYANARNLCIRTGKTYPEAIKTLEKEKARFPIAEKPTSVTMDKIPLSQCVVGKIVRQIKPDRGLQLPGNATVTARRAGLIECVYQGKRHTIDATCLEVVDNDNKKDSL